ncbi:hypothetical protein PVAP13_2NG227000 [Panicum virgatum]|uniref:Secreted protein n=1 Tax=Panicum virgatum TaxID=38727 RepID=A0A8T0VB87_PANVG|nr:hypothetical protein PVAP13_2NG227000 [Panicum virgatum]
MQRNAGVPWRWRWARISLAIVIAAAAAQHQRAPGPEVTIRHPRRSRRRSRATRPPAWVPLPQPPARSVSLPPSQLLPPWSASSFYSALGSLWPRILLLLATGRIWWLDLLPCPCSRISGQQ